MAIELIDKIKQKNNGQFKLVDAIDVELSSGQSVQEFLDALDFDNVTVDLTDYVKGVHYDDSINIEGLQIGVELLSKNGSYIYPVTLETAILDNNGDNLQNKISLINSLINQIKTSMDLKFDNVTAANNEGVITFNFLSDGKIIKTVSVNGGSINIYQGDTAPSNDNILLWIDTNEPDNFTDNIEDRVLEEFRQMILSLNKKIEDLQLKNIELESRISYIEDNGIKPPEPPDPPPDPDGDTVLAFEDDSVLIDENNDIFTFETMDISSNDKLLTFEGEEILVDENNDTLIFEK